MNFLKSFILILVGVLIAPVLTAAETYPLFSCGDNDLGRCVDIPQNTTVLLAKSNKSRGEILTLLRITNGDTIAPVGRSYDGFDWETVAGPYNTLPYTCESDYCKVIIPEVDPALNQVFVLSRFQHELPLRDKVARFLERTTFGITVEELTELEENVKSRFNNDTFAAFADWIQKQMDEIPPTSHRGFFRSRLAARHSDRTPTKEGQMTHPCEKNTRWRSAAFTLQDLEMYLLITRNKSNRYELSIDGYVRTVVDDIVFKDEELFVYDGPTMYYICAFNVPTIGAAFGIKYKNKCRRFLDGNPQVIINGMDTPPKYLRRINNHDDLFVTTPSPHDENMVGYMRSKKDLYDVYPNFCVNVDNDVRSPVFVQLTTTNQVMIFDPYLQLQSNTLENPVEHCGDNGNENISPTSSCPYAPRTFLNENHCKHSFANVYSVSDDLRLHLNEENVRKLYELTGRYYYIVRGLRLGENEDEIYLTLPCQEKSKSRWIKMPEGQKCKSTVKGKTESEYQFQFQFLKVTEFI